MAQPVTNTLKDSATPRPPRTTFLPFALPHITQGEIDEVTDTLRSGWIAAGPKVKRFEREFAEAVGANHAVAMSSATAALHIALEVVGVKPGDEVIVPVYTFTSSAAVHRALRRHASPRRYRREIVQYRSGEAGSGDHSAYKGHHRRPFAGLPAEMDTILDIGGDMACRSSRMPRTPCRRSIAGAWSARLATSPPSASTRPRHLPPAMAACWSRTIPPGLRRFVRPGPEGHQLNRVRGEAARLTRGEGDVAGGGVHLGRRRCGGDGRLGGECGTGRTFRSGG